MPQLNKIELKAMIDAQFAGGVGAANEGLAKILRERLIPELVDSDDVGPRDASISRILYDVRNSLHAAFNELWVSEDVVNEEAFATFLSKVEAKISNSVGSFYFSSGVIGARDVERDVKKYVSTVMKQSWEQRVSSPSVPLHIQEQNREVPVPQPVIARPAPAVSVTPSIVPVVRRAAPPPPPPLPSVVVRPAIVPQVQAEAVRQRQERETEEKARAEREAITAEARAVQRAANLARAAEYERRRDQLSEGPNRQQSITPRGSQRAKSLDSGRKPPPPPPRR